MFLNVNVPVEVTARATDYVGPDEVVRRWTHIVTFDGIQIDYSREGYYETEKAALAGGRAAAQDWARKLRYRYD